MINNKYSRIVIYFMLTILMVDCSHSAKHEDVIYRLTDEQKQFITTVQAGDTVVWENNSGKRDTAVIEPVVYKSNVIYYDKNGDTYQEIAYYKHRYVGSVKSLYLPDGVTVFGTNSSDFGVGTYSNTYSSQYYAYYKLQLSKMIGSIMYTNVYNDGAATYGDTSFISIVGYLGHRIKNETIIKIR